MLKKIYLFIIVALLTAVYVNGQVTTSSITGSVKDKNGNPVEGATISATHEPSGTVYETISRSQGLFDLNGLRIGGPYTVKISHVSFGTEIFNDVTLQLGVPFVITSNLDLNSKNLENVNVTATSKRGQSIKTGASTSVSSEQLRTMPSISRSIELKPDIFFSSFKHF